MKFEGTQSYVATDDLKLLQNENAELRHALAQRDQLLRSWQQQLNTVLATAEDSNDLLRRVH